jgi:hypothetical protein
MLRTIELLVGLQPMTQFDASATPMATAFTAQPHTEPYDLRRPASAGPAGTPAAPTASSPTPTATTSATPHAAGSAASPVATATNPPDAPMAAESDAQDLTAEDRIDARTFNQAIWQAIRGPGSVMPETRHSVTPADGAAASGTDADDHH